MLLIIEMPNKIYHTVSITNFDDIKIIRHHFKGYLSAAIRNDAPEPIEIPGYKTKSMDYARIYIDLDTLSLRKRK